MRRGCVETVITVRADKSRQASASIQTESCMHVASAKLVILETSNTKRRSRLKKLRSQRSKNSDHSYQIKILVTF
jgi:hypothetical protein